MAHIEMRGIRKSYAGVQALKGITLEIAGGEVHALVGENGAGKSTLGKIIAGAEVSDSGELRVSGRQVRYRSPREALAAGIALVHQEMAIARGLSVMDTVFLGMEVSRFGVVRSRPQRERFRELADELGFGHRPTVVASDLGVADQQKVEIMRALAREGSLIVFDEPTAALNSQEADRLHGIVRKLRARGVTFVYISHDLAEVLKIADRVSVLKDGGLISTSEAATESVDSLVRRMLGRSLDAMFPVKRPPVPDSQVALKVRGLARAGTLRNVSLEIAAGEIVGLAGLVGSGRTEVARAIFGADPVDDGHIELNGRSIKIRSPRQAVRRGIAMLPESRKDQALLMYASVCVNLTLPFVPHYSTLGFLRRRAEHVYAQELATHLDIRTPTLETPVANLSGGNQQKVALGKWLGHVPSVLIADEPTRGVDVGARSKIYELIRSLADQGVAVLLISSEVEEIMGLAHRILVMHHGRIVRELSGDAGEDEILTAAFGSS